MTNFDLMRLIMRSAGGHLTPTQQLVLLHLVDRASKDMKCYPSQQLIADQTGFSTRCIKKCIKELQTLGFIEIIVSGKGRNHSNTYQIKPALSTQKGNEVHHLADQEPHNKTDYEGENHPKIEQQMVNVVPEMVNEVHFNGERGSL